MNLAGKYVIPVKSLDDTWCLAVLGDAHLGNRGISLKRLRTVIRRVANTRRCGAILLGDQIDAISPADPRFDASVLDARSLGLTDLANLGGALVDAFIEEVKPIRSKIFAACMGNHEYSLMRRNLQSNLHAYMCRKLDCRDLGYSGFIDLVFEDPQKKRQTFRVYAHHGAGSAITDGGKLNRLIRFMNMVEADIVLTGHTHKLLRDVQTRLAANRDCTELVEMDQCGYVCGTFLRTYAKGVTGYGEIRGYPPVALGGIMLEITPSTREIDERRLRG